jgi:hypothetical protein
VRVLCCAGEGKMHDGIIEAYKSHLRDIRPEGGEHVWREGWHLDRSGMPQVAPSPKPGL